ncbi:hypothetical protein T484DRAFT_1799145 [Baffinella frigidus]|nr:hypothetical protein T484DRAFT_1799145 [Cryptophyta sp. CCMP2293]
MAGTLLRQASLAVIHKRLVPLEEQITSHSARSILNVSPEPEVEVKVNAQAVPSAQSDDPSGQVESPVESEENA